MKSLELSPGKRFKIALNKEKPLQIVGAINAYNAIMATRAGYRALYLSGAGVSNASLGVPDLGIINLNDVLEDARRITNATELPLLVDIDTGWGSELSIARTIRGMIQAGVAAVHIEDQVAAKRCGHRPGKEIVPTQEMVDRIKAAVDARTDDNFVIMARTDALQKEGMEAMLERAHRYIEAGADMLFPEAIKDLEQYHEVTHKIKVPVLANITEFGETPLFTVEELRSVGISMVLYPLSAFRVMNAAANKLYTSLRAEGSQQSQVVHMQTREELYDFLNYHKQENKLDQKK